MSYQAVIRGANNALVIEKQVGVKISILQGSESGTSVYTETHTPMQFEGTVILLPFFTISYGQLVEAE